MKTCNSCGKQKQLDEFYQVKKDSERRMRICKECWKLRQEEYRKNNKTKVFQSRVRTCEKEPTKEHAHKAIEAALIAGVIKRPHTCSMCGCCDSKSRIEAHHHDYSKPLDVIWLCPKCHFEADKRRRDEEGNTPNPICRKVLMLDGEKQVCRFESIADASRAVGISASGISACLNKTRKTAAGYRWAYEDS